MTFPTAGGEPEFDADELLRLAASAERGSEHPLGEAIVERAREAGLELAEPESFDAIPGHGVDVSIGARRVLLGNRRLMDERRRRRGLAGGRSETLAGEGKTPMFVAVDGRIAGIVAVADILKPDSARGRRAAARPGAATST